MAKSNGISGIFRGKKGDGVFYKNGNAASAADVQGWRQRAGKVANPKTTAQVSQRMKMTPAVNLYRSLAGILDHSWQGVKYGGRSHSEFMKHALNMSENFPYLKKGDMRPVPGEYLVSTGSLASLNCMLSNHKVISAEVLSSSFNLGDSTTFGELSQAMVNSGRFNDGDQLTIVFCSATNMNVADANFTWFVKRFILDVNSTANCISFFTELGFDVAVDGWDLSLASTYDSVVAAAVILSRPPLRNGAWQRSTESLVVADEITAAFMSADALATAQESYKKKETTTTSDWYLNQGSVAGPSAGGSSSGGGNNTPGTDNP